MKQPIISFFEIFKRIVIYIIPYGCLILIRKLRRLSKKQTIQGRLYLAENSESNNPFELIYMSNAWGSKESCSGHGSHFNTTKKIRKALPKLWEEYEIKTFLDAPCGDYNWMRFVKKDNINYIGGDIVNAIVENNNKKYKDINISFRKIDITRDELPKVDMILCKDCLQHLSHDNVHKALLNFKKSGSKYLLATSFPLTQRNWDIKDGEYRPLNLLIEPFNLPLPLYEILEDINGGEIDRTDYLFKLEDIKIK